MEYTVSYPYIFFFLFEFYHQSAEEDPVGLWEKSNKKYQLTEQKKILRRKLKAKKCIAGGTTEKYFDVDPVPSRLLNPYKAHMTTTIRNKITLLSCKYYYCGYYVARQKESTIGLDLISVGLFQFFRVEQALSQNPENTDHCLFGFDSPAALRERSVQGFFPFRDQTKLGMRLNVMSSPKNHRMFIHTERYFCMYKNIYFWTIRLTKLSKWLKDIQSIFMTLCFILEKTWN